MRKATKFISVLLSAVLVLTLVVVPGFNAFATTLTAEEAYAVNTLGAELGETLLFETFDKAEMSAKIEGNTAISTDYTNMAGWEFYDTAGFLWHNNTGYVKVNAGSANFWCSYGDSAIVLPQLNAENYIYSVKVKRAGWGAAAARMSIVTGIGADAANSNTYQRFGVVYDSNTDDGVFTVDGIFTRKNTESDNVPVEFTNSYDLVDFVTFSVVSYQGTNYYFINGDYITSVVKNGVANERLAVHITTADIRIDDVSVKALNVPVVKSNEEKYAENTLGAELGDVLLEEDFGKGDMAKVTGNSEISGDYTRMPGWEFFDTTSFIWHNNAGTVRILNGGIEFWCSSGNSVLMLPQLNTSDYIFTAKIKRGGWGSAAASAGIITDVAADAANSTTNIRLFGTYDSATEDGAFTLDKIGTKKNGNADVIVTTEKTYDLANYTTFTVVSYQGTNYYFIDGDYITSVAKLGIEDERLGFYISTADIYVDDVSVRALNVPPPAEEKLALSLGAELGDVLLQEDFGKGDMAKVTGNSEISGDYTRMPGWEFLDTTSFIWHNNAGSVRILNGGINFWCSNGNSVLMLPQLNTSDYIFTAKIKRGGWGSAAASAGIITDVAADAVNSTTNIRFYGTYDSATEDGAFTLDKIGTKKNSNADVIVTTEKTYDLVNYTTFSVVSYQGTNYYFIDGDYITSIAKLGIEDERLGFYISTADIYVDDVTVTALNAPFESELVDVFGMNAVKIGSVEDNETYTVSFDYIAENDFNVGFFTADEDNAGSIGYVEGKDVSVFTATASDDISTATTYVTVDKKGASSDAVGADLYMYIIGDTADVAIANVTAQKITNANGGALISNGGVAILKDVAENETQAMRYFFNYDTTAGGGNIVIDGTAYTVKSRGFLIANGDVSGGEQITRTTAVSANVIDFNVTNLSKCWSATANGDALGSDSLCYSMYVTGFGAVNGTYNNTNRLYVKGYVVVEIDGTDYTFYAEEANMTVSDVANLIK